MISKTQLSKRIHKKTNPEIVETIRLAKEKNLLELAKRLSAPKSHYTTINLDSLNTMKEDKIIIVGKVLGSGTIERKIMVGALGFSKQAFEKMKKANCTLLSIKESIIKNKTLDGFTVV